MKDKQPYRPYASIQWKGTGVCMDVYCVCGAHLHVDDEFVYYVQCPHCLKMYQMDTYVAMSELSEGSEEPRCCVLADPDIEGSRPIRRVKDPYGDGYV